MYFIQPVHHMILISSDESKVKPQIIQVVHPSVQGVLVCHIEVWKLFFQWPENCFEAMTWKLWTIVYILLRSSNQKLLCSHSIRPCFISWAHYSQQWIFYLKFSHQCSPSWISVYLVNSRLAVISEISSGDHLSWIWSILHSWSNWCAILKYHNLWFF